MTEPGGGEAQARRAPRWLRWVTRVALAIGVIAFVAAIAFVGPRVLVHHLQEIGWFFLLIIAIDVTASLCDATAVYFMALGPNHPRWREHVVAQLAGRGVNGITPGGNLGEAVKVGLLSQRCSPRRIVAAVMFVGLVHVVISLFVIAIGTAATAFLFDVPASIAVVLLVGATLATAAAITIIVLIRRGMLASLTRVLERVRIVSSQRRASWRSTLEEIDDRLRGENLPVRRRALVFVLLSQAVYKVLTFVIVFAAGYALSPAQFVALISAGVLLGWISTLVPMGLGISESGNVALFAAIGAPPAIGLALALARRLDQVVFAAIGFFVLTADRVTRLFEERVRSRLPLARRRAARDRAPRDDEASYPQML